MLGFVDSVSKCIWIYWCFQ